MLISNSGNFKRLKVFFLLAYTFGFWLFTFPCYALNLEQVKSYFLEGDYKAAILEGEKLIAQYNHSANADELYYILALSYLKDGNYLRASDIFEIILNEFKNSKFREEAKLGLGDTYFLRNDFVKAQDIYKDLLNSNHSADIKGILYYRLSQTGFKTGNIQQGKEYMDKLNLDFPLNLESKLNKDICFLPDSTSGLYYTVQVGSFSNSVNAKNLVQRLSHNDYPAYIEEVTLQCKTSYRVRVGKLRSRQEAENLEKRLTQEGYPTKICP
jgi:tetratricopeptide (TPR) repeat protein